MTHRKHPSLTAVAIFVALVMSPATGASPDRIGGYDFSYEMSGDGRVRPVQVFDDGQSTFFQFRAGEPIPAIFAATAGGAVLVLPQLEGPYVKVPSVSGAFALRLGYGTGKVVYQGGSRLNPVVAPAVVSVATAQPAPAQIAAPQVLPERLLAASQLVTGLPREMFRDPTPRIALEENSYATPLKGDSVEWATAGGRSEEFSIAFGRDATRLTPAATKLIRSIVGAAKPNSRWEVLGRDDDGHKDKVAELRADAVVSALLLAGVSRTSIQQRTTAEVKDAGKGAFFGVSLKVSDPPVSRPTVRPGNDVAAIVERLRSGSISPSQALALLEAARTATPKPAAVMSAAPASVSMPTVWAMKKTDETVERMLGRWAREAGWKLVWQGGPNVPITGDASFERPDYLNAAEYVITQAKAAGYKLKATAYSNQTLVISGD